MPVIVVASRQLHHATGHDRTRHGFANISGADVRLVVGFVPGGFEELFLRYRDAGNVPQGKGFAVDAERDFASTFEAED